MSQTASEVFGGLGITPEEAEAALVKSQRRRRNGGICLCGHSAMAHTEFVEKGSSSVHDAARINGKNTCAPSKHVCPCEKYQEVLQTSDARRFRFSTTGPAGAHALMKGVVSAFTSDVDVWWDNDAECAKCKIGKLTVGATLVPVAYTKDWFESHEATDLNVLVCEDCRETIMREFAGIPEKRRP